MVVPSLGAARNSARGFPLVPSAAHFHRRAAGADIAPMPFGCFDTLSRTTHFAFEDFRRCSFTCRWHHVRLAPGPIAPPTLVSVEIQLQVSVEDVAFLSIFNSRCRSYDC